MARAKASAQVYKSRRSVRISSRTNGEQKGESEDQTDEQDLAVSSSKAKNSLTKRLRGGGDTGKKSSKKPRMELNGGWISDDNNTAEEGNPSSEEEKAVTLEEQRKSNEELFRKLYEANYVDEAKKTLLEVAEDTTRKSARNRGIGELPSKRVRESTSTRQSIRLMEDGEKKAKVVAQIGLLEEEMPPVYYIPGDVKLKDCLYEKMDWNKGIDDLLKSTTWKSSLRSSRGQSVQSRALDPLVNELSKLRISEEGVVKVTPYRIFSMAVHPGNQLLVAAGDSYGYIGLWNVHSTSADTKDEDA